MPRGLQFSGPGSKSVCREVWRQIGQRKRLVRSLSMSIPHLFQQTSMTTKPRGEFRAYSRGIGGTESLRHLDAPLRINLSYGITSPSESLQ